MLVSPRLPVWLPVCVSLLCVGISFGQLDRGTITGAVTDPLGAVVPNATVTVTNMDTNVPSGTTTTRVGDFTIPALLLGRYRVQVQAPGFKLAVRDNVIVSAASTIRVDVALDIGASSERVEVSAVAAPISSDSTNVTTTLANKLVDDVPLEVNGQLRSVFDLATLTPDAKTGTSGLYRIAGGQDGGWDMQMDGMSITPTSDAKTAARVVITAVPIDAINEFTVESNSGMKAEYGQAMGMINFATKSGTNQYHGDAFDFLRNDALDARGFFASSNPRLQQNDFGATFGGPVRIPKVYDGKDRTFFFLSYEGYRNRQGSQPAFFTIPVPANYQGDFSNYVNNSGNLIQIYDPATTRAAPSGSGSVRDPFPGNQIPAGRFSPLAVNYSKLRSPDMVPNVPGVVVNNYFRQQGSVTLPFDKGTARMDHHLSAKDSIGGLFMRGETATIAGPDGGPGLPAPYTSLTIQDLKSTYFNLFWTRIINPHTVNELRFNQLKGYGFVDAQACASAEKHWGALVGVQNVPGPDSCMPPVTFTNTYTSYATIPGGRGRDDSWIWTISESVTIVHGAHTYKAGFSFGKNNWAGGGSEAGNGVYGFSQLATAIPGDQSQATGNAFASFLLGYPNTVQVSTPRREVFIIKNLGSFFQDDWRVNSKLTLNLGLRYDYSFPYAGGGIAPGVQPGYSNLGVTTPNPGAGGRPGAIIYTGTGPGRTGSASPFPTWPWEFEPRAGLAYSVRRGTVLRASGSRGFEALRVQGGTGNYDGFITNTTFTSSDLDINSFPANTSLAAPPYVHVPNLIPTVDNGTNVTYWDTSQAGTPAEYWTYNFDIQQQIASSSVLTVRYTGVRGEHLTSGLTRPNQISPGYLTTLGPTLLTSSITSAAARTAGIPIPYAGFNGTVQQALSPFPQYQTLSLNLEHRGDSTYHALVVKFDRRYSNGFTMLGSYTLSKMFSNADSYSSGTVAMDSFNLAIRKSLSADDQTHLLRFSVSYELPFGKGRQFLSSGILAHVIGNWTLAGSAAYASGRPQGIATGVTLPIGGGADLPFITSYTNWRASYSGNFNPFGNLWWDKSAFNQQPQTILNTVMGNSTVWNPKARLPWSLNEDVNIARTFPVRENLRLTLRVEAFNLLNRHIWASPNNTLNSAAFGQVRAQSDNPRQVQLVAKIYF
jgi:outer membrane receptor protein involved in Fe transport